MTTYINPDDYRVKGEKFAFYFGLSILTFTLFLSLIVPSIILPLSGVPLIITMLITLFVYAGFTWIRQGQLIGNTVRVSSSQFPDIYAITKEASNRLGMHPPEVFIKQAHSINAFATGFLGKKSIVIFSETIEAMGTEELTYIIGHELSHIKCGHTNLLILAGSKEGLEKSGISGTISAALGIIFSLWSHKCEYTCDRGGLLANRDLKATISAICKLAIGPKLFEQMNVEDFLNQQMMIEQNDIARFSEILETHPYLIKRIHAIQKYFESNEYKLLTSKNE